MTGENPGVERGNEASKSSVEELRSLLQTLEFEESADMQAARQIAAEGADEGEQLVAANGVSVYNTLGEKELKQSGKENNAEAQLGLLIATALAHYDAGNRDLYYEGLTDALALAHVNDKNEVADLLQDAIGDDFEDL